jgi:iron complex transport system substrate-binding protein
MESKTMIRNKTLFTRKWFVMFIAVALVLAGCSQKETGPKGNEQEDSTQSEQSQNKEQVNQFPRSVDVNGKTVTIDQKPNRIAALSINVAEVAMDLVGAEPIIAVTKSMENESLSHNSLIAKEVANKVAGATSLDPEAVLAYKPDLVLLTLTHGAEQDADKLLQSAGVPLASFDRWSTVETVMENYELIGQLLGEEEKAEQIVKSMKEKVSRAQEMVQKTSKKPSVLVLSQVGSNTGPYILGPTSIAYDIINLAGGTPGSDLIGLERNTPATIEQVINMDPDYIILVEWGSTSGEYTQLIESSGFKTLKAVKAGNVKRMAAKDISQANQHVVNVLEELVNWIHVK